MYCNIDILLVKTVQIPSCLFSWEKSVIYRYVNCDRASLAEFICSTHVDRINWFTLYRQTTVFVDVCSNSVWFDFKSTYIISYWVYKSLLAKWIPKTIVERNEIRKIVKLRNRQKRFVVSLVPSTRNGTSEYVHIDLNSNFVLNLQWWNDNFWHDLAFQW